MSRIHKFECDRAKARSNFVKHKLRFTEACRIFGRHVLTMPSSQNAPGKEPRNVSLGALSQSVAAVVVWTKRDGHIRIISARKASSAEKERYEAHIKKSTN